MGWLDQLLRRAAPGDVPADPMAGSVMSPNYVPQTSGRQLGLGALRGVLDLTPVGVADAVQSGINNMQSPLGAALRAVVGKSALPGDMALGKLGLLGSGPGYDAGRYAANAAAPMMGLLGNQAGGALPKGYARNQSGAIVWHGSPHKFDKFDASRIGESQGGKLFGGLGFSFADNPADALLYGKNLYKVDIPDSSILDVRGKQNLMEAFGDLVPRGWTKPYKQIVSEYESAKSKANIENVLVKDLPGGWKKVHWKKDGDWHNPSNNRISPLELADDPSGMSYALRQVLPPDYRSISISSFDPSEIPAALAKQGKGAVYFDGSIGHQGDEITLSDLSKLRILERNGRPIR